MNKMKIKNMIDSILFWASLTVLILGIGLFLVINNAIINNQVIFILFLAIGIVAGIVLRWYIGKTESKNKKRFLIVSWVMLLATIAISVYLLMQTLIVNFWQPISLSTPMSIVVIAGVVLQLISAIYSLILTSNSRKVVGVFAIVLSFFFTMTGFAVFQDMTEFENVEEVFALFENGEADYTTFRIPSIISMDKNSINEIYGYEIENDLLLATCEGRKNSFHDRGDIDIVGKVSADNGKTWSEVMVIFEVEGEVGKYGNPTPVYDEDTGLVNFLCMTGVEKNNFKYSTYNIRCEINKDFSLTKKDQINLNDQLNIEAGESVATNANSLMVGPGKSIQLESGRLIVPASQRNISFAIYSDDNGLTWSRSGDFGSGNENEIVEMANGELLMVSREATPCDAVHNEQYQRFAISNDQGETWTRMEESKLKTPVCMASLASYGDTVYFSYPDDFLTRANLTVATSNDNGNTFELISIYQGATGYSCIETNGDGDVFVLAEVGAVNYCEQLVFVKIKA